MYAALLDDPFKPRAIAHLDSASRKRNAAAVWSAMKGDVHLDRNHTQDKMLTQARGLRVAWIATQGVRS